MVGALRDGGGENKPVRLRRSRCGAGGGDDEGERVRERARLEARFFNTLCLTSPFAVLLLLPATAVDDDAPSDGPPIQNCSSARASLSSSAIASSVIVLRFLWPTATAPSLLLGASSLSDSGSGTAWSSSSSDDESVTRERERRLRLWVVRGGVGGRAGMADAARRIGGLLVDMDGASGAASAGGLTAARTLGIVESVVDGERRQVGGQT